MMSTFDKNLSISYLKKGEEAKTRIQGAYGMATECPWGKGRTLQKIEKNSLTVFLKLGNYYISQLIKLIVKYYFSGLDYVRNGMSLLL